MDGLEAEGMDEDGTVDAGKNPELLRIEPLREDEVGFGYNCEANIGFGLGGDIVGASVEEKFPFPYRALVCSPTIDKIYGMTGTKL